MFKQDDFLKKYLGIALIVFSFLLWIPVVSLPFLPLSLEVKGVLVTGFVVLAEICFWVGGLIAGKDALKKCFQKTP